MPTSTGNRKARVVIFKNPKVSRVVPKGGPRWHFEQCLELGRRVDERSRGFRDAKHRYAAAIYRAYVLMNEKKRMSALLAIAYASSRRKPGSSPAVIAGLIKATRPSMSRDAVSKLTHALSWLLLCSCPPEEAYERLKEVGIEKSCVRLRQWNREAALDRVDGGASERRNGREKSGDADSAQVEPKARGKLAVPPKHVPAKAPGPPTADAVPVRVWLIDEAAEKSAELGRPGRACDLWLTGYRDEAGRLVVRLIVPAEHKPVRRARLKIASPMRNREHKRKVRTAK